MTKRILLAVLLLLSFATNAQPWRRVEGMGTRPKDTAYIARPLLVDSVVSLPYYKDPDSAKVLAVDANGKVYQKTVTGGGGSPTYVRAGWGNTVTRNGDTSTVTSDSATVRAWLNGFFVTPSALAASYYNKTQMQNLAHDSTDAARAYTRSYAVKIGADTISFADSLRIVHNGNSYLKIDPVADLYRFGRPDGASIDIDADASIITVNQAPLYAPYGFIMGSPSFYFPGSAGTVGYSFVMSTSGQAGWAYRSTPADWTDSFAFRLAPNFNSPNGYTVPSTSAVNTLVGNYLLKVDTAAVVAAYARTQRMLDSLSAHWTAINLRVKYSDTANLVAAYARTQRMLDSLTNHWTAIQSKQALLNGTGLVRMSGNTVSYDNNTYLTTNQTITASGDATGSGTTSLPLTITGLRGAALPSLSIGNLRYNGSAWVMDNTAYQSTTLADGKILIGNSSNTATARTLTGDITVNDTGLTAIGTGKVTSNMILDGTIGNGDIANGTIDLTTKVATISVGTYTPTTSGFSGTPTATGSYMIIGKWLFLTLYVDGTSNANSMTVTLPSGQAAATAGYSNCLIVNNGGGSSPGMIGWTIGSGTLTCYTTSVTSTANSFTATTSNKGLRCTVIIPLQ